MRNRWLPWMAVGLILMDWPGTLTSSRLLAQIQLPRQPAVNLASFQQNIDVFDWAYRLGYHGVARSLRYAIGLNLTSSMLKSGAKKKWKDLQDAFLTFGQTFRPNLQTYLKLQHMIFKDELSNFNYDRQLSAVTLATNWSFKTSMEIQPELGFRWERRNALMESGLYTGMLINMPPQRLGEYQNMLYAWGEATRLRDRRNGTARVKYSVWREFQPGSKDSLIVHLDLLRRDNFFSNPLSGRIESLRKSEQGITNFLTYRISETSEFRLHTVLTSTKVTVKRLDRGRTTASRSHEDFEIRNRMDYRWQYRRLDSHFELEMGESAVNYDIPDSSGFSPFSRRFATLGYDIEEKFTRIAMRFFLPISRSDSLRLYTELQKVQHDNSDLRNPDSYDEQRWQVSLLHQRQINPFFTLSWEANVFLKHFVYLHEQFSAQNNWTRLFQIEPRVRLTVPGGFLFVQSVGVRAQYVDYDFDELQPIRSSYVIRDFFLQDSLVANLGNDLTFSLNYRFELEELGSLDWERFTSRPRTQWRNHWINLQFSQEIWPGFQYVTGVVFYRQARYRMRQDKEGNLLPERIGVHTNLGPVLRLSYTTQNGSTILFSGERQRVLPFEGEDYYVNHIQLSVHWRF
ncbi:MAG: hypothetical protein Q9P90_11030 [candidate division KSB1 bacterium]|nr:hypothetical protein [candidate division KSB1 bacterium]